MDGIHLRPGRPLLTASARPWAGALPACCAILVAVLGVLFTHQAKADWLDHAADSPIITWFAGHPGLAVRLAAPGSPIPAGALSAAIVVACVLTGRLNGTGTVCGLALILDLPAARRWLARASSHMPEAQEHRSRAARQPQTST